MSTTHTAALPLGEHNSRHQSVVEEGPATEDKATLAPNALESDSTEESGAALADQLALVKLAPTATAGLDSSGKLFDRLPFEVVEIIFALVHQDWAKMPSPFQLLHVSRRWTALAQSMPKLWRDTRIIRVAQLTLDDVVDGLKPVRRPYRFEPASKQSTKQLYVFARCAELSHDSLEHIELEIWQWYHGENAGLRAFFRDLFKRSRATVKSVTFLTRSCSKSVVYKKGRSPPRDFIDLVMQCPNVADLDLNLCSTLHGLESILSTSQIQNWQLTPSFRQVTLDCGSWLRNSDVRARQYFLQRCSQLRSLALRRVLGIGAWCQSAQARQDLCFILELLATCANTLASLDIEGALANILNDLNGSQQIDSLPQLRHFRYVPIKAYAMEGPQIGKVEGVIFPRLETIEAPVDVMMAFPCVPPHIAVRLDEPSKSGEDCKKLLEWLRTLRAGAHLIQSLTIRLALTTRLAPLQRAAIDGLIQALTPSSNAGAILCPHLTEFKIIIETAHGDREKLDSEGSNLAQLDVEGLFAMEEERREISRGRPLVEMEEPEGHDGSVTASPVCRAITSIELVGCYVDREAWVRMERSACRFKVDSRPAVGERS